MLAPESEARQVVWGRGTGRCVGDGVAAANRGVCGGAARCWEGLMVVLLMLLQIKLRNLRQRLLI